MKASPRAMDGSQGSVPSVEQPVPALELRGVSKRYGAVQALSNVDLDAFSGEVLALVGDNGAGKSTLVKAVAGVHEVDDGSILVDGQEVRFRSPADAYRAGIEVIYQDLSVCDNLDVVANIYLGREASHRLGVGRLRLLDESEMERRVVETLASLGVTIPSPRSRLATLSGGQRQAVEIARAVMWNSRILLLDEPTAALGVSQTHQVLELIKRLAREGLAVVVISHSIPEVLAVADRIVVLRLGRLTATFDRATATREAVVAAITGGG